MLETQNKWLRALILIALGLLTVAALPPVYIWPAAFIGASGLFLFLDRAPTKKAAFLIGWLFGIGFFGGGLYWLTNAFLVNPELHGWLIPIAVPALAGVIGLYTGTSTLLAYLLWRGSKDHGGAAIGRIVLFALAWAVMEWIRGWLFTGFPWNLIGTIWGFSDEMMQGAAYLGAYGLSFVTILGATLPAAFVYVAKKRWVVAGLCILAVPALLWTTGYLRLSNAQTTVHDDITLRLVQPNIAQSEKWKSELKIRNFQTHLELSAAPGKDGTRPSHIIWPETAATFPLNREDNVRAAVASVVPSGGSVLTGTPRMTPRGEKPFKVWNSMVAINETGEIIANYDKAHLVPFGEYIPLRQWIPIPKLTAGSVDFSAGEGVQSITAGNLPPFSALICYEIIFPHKVLNQENNTDWLLNLTNDGWYGNSPGPYQHLISARMRSVEEGVPLIRVANTGVTVATDAYGRVQASIPYGVRGFVDVALAKPLALKPPASSFGIAIFWGLAALSCLVGQFLVSHYRKR